jgi:hypothetical protein
MALDIRAVAQVRVIPDVVVIILVEAFDAAITLWVIQRAKHQFRTNRQGQTDDFAQNTRVGKTPTKTALIVDLGVLRQAHHLPGVNQKLSRLLRPPTGVGLAGRVAGHHVNGIEASDGLPTGQKMRHDVYLTELVRLNRVYVRINDLRCPWFWSRSGHPGRPQYPLNAGGTGQGVNLFLG